MTNPEHSKLSYLRQPVTYCWSVSRSWVTRRNWCWFDDSDTVMTTKNNNKNPGSHLWSRLWQKYGVLTDTGCQNAEKSSWPAETSMVEIVLLLKKHTFTHLCRNYIIVIVFLYKNWWNLQNKLDTSYEKSEIMAGMTSAHTSWVKSASLFVNKSPMWQNIVSLWVLFDTLC